MLLHWACLAGREQLVDFILKHSSPEIDTEDDSQATFLILSVLGGHFGLVQLLVAKGADVNHKKQGGHSSLQYAASKGFKDVLEYLIKKGADVNAVDERLDTALHRAATLGRTAIAKILIESGANVNAQNREGNTPLHLALEDEQSEVAFLLFDNGADPKILNRAKQTAIDLCKPNIKRQMREKYPTAEAENWIKNCWKTPSINLFFENSIQSFIHSKWAKLHRDCLRPVAPMLPVDTEARADAERSQNCD